MLFKDMEEFNKFCDESMICVCGRLMTGLHMSGCKKLAKMRLALQKHEQEERKRQEEK